jgi:hypothetical protein
MLIDNGIIRIEEYERTYKQNEFLGLDDISNDCRGAGN